jgi:hypothetical protein
MLDVEYMLCQQQIVFASLCDACNMPFDLIHIICGMIHRRTEFNMRAKLQAYIFSIS